MIPVAGWSDHALRRAYAQSLGSSAGLGDRRSLSRAGRALHARMSRLYGWVGEEEAAAFRAYVGEAVTTVSPLLVRLCELEGHDLDALVAKLAPLGAWPPWLCGWRPGEKWQRRIVGAVLATPSPTETAAWRFQELVHGGCVVQDLLHPGIPFGVRVLNRGLEMAAMLGEHRIRTHGREGSMTLKAELPRTVAIAMPGRPLDVLVSHPLLDGAGCLVTEVSEPNRRGTKVRFALEPVAWRMPWARSTATTVASAGGDADTEHGDAVARSVASPRPAR